ncbi:hypothetical protein DFP76_101236 [Marinomonas aquiplantarum]|uniref:Uncharacterized protein n=1 Tax=Marinomonas aquiplantarum TaxID=491951 RepID=A0A366D7E5_9GAMM|nr:hypothetical protein DFP76_101236 [Marinomonas aquiplantarum]
MEYQAFFVIGLIMSQVLLAHINADLLTSFIERVLLTCDYQMLPLRAS